MFLAGLIESCENEAELSGVLGHELAHIRKNHIMKKLVKEFGLSVLITITSGNRGAEVIQNALHDLASSSYSRELESEADRAAADYMIAADVNPAPFADFLYRLSTSDSTQPRFMHLIATHPASKERAEAIVQYLKNKKYVTRDVLAPGEWEMLHARIKRATADK